MGLIKSMMGGMNGGQAVADHDSLQGQAHEFNRILGVGQPGQALIRGHVDAGEQVAGNPVWVFDLEVTPEGGAPYIVQHREVREFLHGQGRINRQAVVLSGTSR